MAIGKLNRRVSFDAPAEIPDGHGGIETGWASPDDALTVWANFRYLRGGETVQAARLEGRQPIVVTVRTSSATRVITEAWRMRDRDGLEYNIRSGPVPTDNRAYLEFTVEGGVAV
jgi:SPP1 family predicted phage head-tail adaptor